MRQGRTSFTSIRGELALLLAGHGRSSGFLNPNSIQHCLRYDVDVAPCVTIITLVYLDDHVPCLFWDALTIAHSCACSVVGMKWKCRERSRSVCTRCVLDANGHTMSYAKPEQTSATQSCTADPCVKFPRSPQPAPIAIVIRAIVQSIHEERDAPPRRAVGVVHEKYIALQCGVRYSIAMTLI